MIIWENRVLTAPALETMIAITALFIEAVKTAPCIARIYALTVWKTIFKYFPLENDNPRQLSRTFRSHILRQNQHTILCQGGYAGST